MANLESLEEFPRRESALSAVQVPLCHSFHTHTVYCFLGLPMHLAPARRASLAVSQLPS